MPFRLLDSENCAEYLTDAQRSRYLREDKDPEKFFKDLSDEVDRLTESGAVRVLLCWLFPEYRKLTSKAAIRYQARRADRDAVDQKLICVADYFQIYFRAAVPEEMFGNAELERFLSDLNSAATPEAHGAAFNRVFNSIPKGHQKRGDFMWRLSRKLDRLSEAATEHLAYAAAAQASEYVYDLMNVGEAAEALKIVFAAAQRLSATTAVQRVLEGAMRKASHDTFAVGLLDGIENRDRNHILLDFSHVEVARVEHAFVERMRNRYGQRPQGELVISHSDWWAFRRWIKDSDKDREVEREFWRRFIGGGRKRLAQAINFIYPGGVAWQGSPVPMVDELFPLVEFKRLLGELHEGEDWTISKRAGSIA